MTIAGERWNPPPLFLIGAARSGTTLLGDVLACHPQVAYWVEPKYVWRHGAHGSPHDLRTGAEATAEVRDYIRSRFDSFRHQRSRRFFLEKTPSNCLRVPFIDRVFPEGRYLHILRDGRDVVASAFRRWTMAPDDRALVRRLRRFEIPLTSVHHYLPDLLREAVLRRLQPQRGHIWGPRYPGLLEQIPNTDILTLCCNQWIECIRIATRELAELAPGKVLTLRYEDFVRSPRERIQEILDFAGLPESAEVSEASARARSDRIGRYDRLPLEQRQLIEQRCEPVMRELGLA